MWSHDGLICTGETYKNVVKLTFSKGAQLRDPSNLFNSSLEGNARRAIDQHEGDKVDDSAFKALIRDAMALNTSARRGRAGTLRVDDAPPSAADAARCLGDKVGHGKTLLPEE